VCSVCCRLIQVDIPKAPGLGLMLERVHYDGYNKKYGTDGLHEEITWDEYKVKFVIVEYEHHHQHLHCVQENEITFF